MLCLSSTLSRKPVNMGPHSTLLAICSIIKRSEVVPTSMAHNVSGTDLGELDPQLFEIQTIQGKGKGLVACSHIAKGTRILQEKPLLTIEKVLPMDRRELNLVEKLMTLSELQRHMFHSLHNNFPGEYPCSGIVDTNAWLDKPDDLDSDSSDHPERVSIYPKISRINHSCLPNAYYYWNSNTKCATVHAICPINAGDEITVHYLGTGTVFESRRVSLKKGYGFDCTCSLCSLPPLARQNSDTRRLRIQHLDEALNDWKRSMDYPDDGLADCYSLLQHVQDEYQDSADIFMGKVYYDAFQIYIAHGDQARAKVFAERKHQLDIIHLGEDNPDTWESKDLAENPSKHNYFGLSSRWETAQDLVSEGLGTDAFEAWLWGWEG